MPATASTIPAPAGLPLVGNLLQIPRGRLTQHLMGLAGRFDGIFDIDFAGVRVPFVTSAALVAELCDEKRFRKTIKPPLSLLRAVAGDGLFTAHGDEPNWGKAHRILTPAFGQRARRAYFDAMHEVAGQLVSSWSSRHGEPLEVADDMTRLTLDTIALCGFGYRFDSFAAPELHPFLQAMGRVLDETMGRLTRLVFVSRLRWRANRRFDQDVAAMHALVDDVIRRRRAHADSTRDLLGLMLEAVDPVTGGRLDDENIRYQVITFLIAGHETTSGLLSFVLYLLTQHPEVTARARAEVDAVLPGGRPPVYEDLASFDVIDRILKEALRLWPTAPAFAVAPFEDTTLGGRYLIERDRRVTVLLPALHRDPAVWSDPERFDIDRFLPHNEARIPTHAYKPFGNGQRSCIGRQFAIMEAKLAIALIVQQFEFEAADDYHLAVRETLTLKPDRFRLRVRRRLTPGS
jgi:cytochrome P450/NADPH-cytochrome P450 reductase